MKPFLATPLRPLLLAAATTLAWAGPAAADGGSPHWGYDEVVGPTQWTGIAPACSGSQQSPINLWSSTIRHGDHRTLDTDYERSRFRVLNNGHTLQASPLPGHDNHIEIDGERFTLSQFHVHTPSEHKVDGQPHDMELHLVHTGTSGRTAVVAVFFDVGDANPALTELLDRATGELSHPGDQINLYAALDPGDLLPRHSRVVHYTGSLTTPPCTEGVLWNIEMDAQQLSAAQLDNLRFIYPHNARPIQSFNARALVDDPGAP